MRDLTRVVLPAQQNQTKVVKGHLDMSLGVHSQSIKDNAQSKGVDKIQM